MSGGYSKFAFAETATLRFEGCLAITDLGGIVACSKVNALIMIFQSATPKEIQSRLICQLKPTQKKMGNPLETYLWTPDQ